jgi:chromosome segregation ATPase
VTTDVQGILEMQRLEIARLLTVEQAAGARALEHDVNVDRRMEEIDAELREIKARRPTLTDTEQLAQAVTRDSSLRLEKEALGSARRQMHAFVADARRARENAEGELRMLRVRVQELRARRKKLARGIHDSQQKIKELESSADFWRKGADALSRELDAIGRELLALAPGEELGVTVSVIERPIL